MYDHIGLRVRDLDASIKFYTAALAPLGYVLNSRDDSGAGFGPKDASALWLYLDKGPAGAGAHIALRPRVGISGFRAQHGGRVLARRMLRRLGSTPTRAPPVPAPISRSARPI